MSEVHFESISSQYNNILRSKYSKIFLELFSKFIDDPSFYSEAIFLQNEQKTDNLFSKNKKIIFSSWYEIYLNSCDKQQTQNLPILAFNYCYEKAKDLYLKLKKFSKTKKIKFIYISRTIYKEFNTFIQLDKRNYLKAESSPKDEKISLRNFLKQRTTNSLIHINTISSSNPQNKLMNKILSETEDEKKEEKQKQNSNYINRINKLNIFVGEYDTLLLDQVVEKTKIYDGNLCTTYLVKREVDKKIGEGKDGKEKVKRLLSDGKTIFIANDSSSNSENVFRAPFIKTSGTSRVTMDKLKLSLNKDKSPEGKSSSKNITASNFNFRSSRNSKNNSKFSSGVIPKIDTGFLNHTKKNSVPVFLLNSNKRNNNYIMKEQKVTDKINYLLDSDNNINNNKRRSSTPSEYKTFQNEMRGVKFKMNVYPEITPRTNSSTGLVLNSILRKTSQLLDEKENSYTNTNIHKSPIMAKLMYPNV